MDPNLLYWKSHGQSFLRRVQIWFEVLDPTFLISPDFQITRAHSLMGRGEICEKDSRSVHLALSSIQADSGTVLPIVLRPPAFMPLVTFTALGAFSPHRTLSQALIWQFLLQSQTATFNYGNRNASSEQEEKTPLEKLASFSGATFLATGAAILPQLVIPRLPVTSAPARAFLRSVSPIPFSAAAAFLNIWTVRSSELESGIQVFDSNGNPVGFSKAAGEQAVRETALSRAALFGAAAAAPSLLVPLANRSELFRRNPLLAVAFRQISLILVLGLMIPVSFSLFPQLGTIKREKLEEHMQAAAGGGHLFYHRGV